MVEESREMTMLSKALKESNIVNCLLINRAFKGALDNILLVITHLIATCDNFSEDIDIAMRREGKFSIASTSGNQLARVRRTARHYVVRELPEELTEALNKMGIVDFTVEPELTRTDNEGNTTELRATTTRLQSSCAINQFCRRNRNISSQR